MVKFLQVCTMKNILCLGLMLLPLAACAAAPHHNTSSADGDHSNHVTPSLCLPDQAKKLVGKAGLSDAQIQQKTAATVVRRVGPNQAVTMDYSETRITITIDPQSKKITHAACG